jgi:hypothetical protein
MQLLTVVISGIRILSDHTDYTSKCSVGKRDFPGMKWGKIRPPQQAAGEQSKGICGGMASDRASSKRKSIAMTFGIALAVQWVEHGDLHELAATRVPVIP